MNKVVIVAGGMGTRMGKLSESTPKSLMRAGNKPIISYQIENLKKYGLRDIILVVNHLGGAIKEYCGDGKRFGVNISYFEEQKPLGTAGGIKLLKRKLGDDFVVVYGDILFNIDFRALLARHYENKKAIKNHVGTLVVHPNNHPLDSDLVDISENGRILNFLSKPHAPDLCFRNLVNAALYVLTSKVHRYIPTGEKTDFGKDIFPKILAKKGALFAYHTPEYTRDMGTPERLNEGLNDIKSGLFKQSSLRTKRPAIFLDRDGVINKEVGNLRRAEDFILLPNAAKAIRKINQTGYYAVVISNQPVVAKGFCTMDELLEINKKMETLLGIEGAKLDAVYFCPHHPDKGFPGENKKYKVVCGCRKPKTGMIQNAKKNFNIDLKRSIMVGDSTRDSRLAENLGIKFFGVKTGEALKDNKYELRKKPKVYKDLFAVVNAVIKNKHQSKI